MLQPLVGGSGGSGGWSASGTNSGAGGGAGGGAIRICSDTSVTLSAPPTSAPFESASIWADGGAGGFGSPNGPPAFHGGPGSGGSIHIQAPAVLLGDMAVGGRGTMRALGGTMLNGAGDRGSSGRIRIDANNVVYLGPGSVNPIPALGRFGGVALPQPPTVTVLSLNGVSVNANPSNNPQAPDVSVTASGPVAIAIQTANIPDGTLAKFYISTDAGASDIVQDATVTANAATLNVTLPQGVNRLFVRASF